MMADEKAKAKKQKKTRVSSGPQSSLITRFKNWLIDSYNGLFKIVIQPQLPKPRTIGLLTLAFLVGMIWAYGVAPARFYNGSPSQMSAGGRDQWVKLVAGSYTAGLYSDQQTLLLLQQIENPAGTVNRLIGTETGQVQVSLQEILPLAQQAGAGRSAPSSGNIISSILTFVLAIIAFVLFINIFALLWGLIIGGYVERFLARFKEETEDDRKAKKAIEGIRQRKALEEQMKQEASLDAASPLGPPIMQRVSPYQKGRAFDDSFAIEDANDMFLGECGATIAKTIGDNELAAIEIWLFDKEDFVRTLTKLFVSQHIYNDPVARAELESKVDDPANDIVLAQPGAVIILETGQLRMQAKIAELVYGSGPLPPNSYFESLNIRMEAWQKSGTTAAMPAPVGGGYAPPPPPPAPAGLPSLDTYEIGPPPSMPSGMSAPQAAPPPSMPTYNPNPTQPSAPYGGGVQPLTPPPLRQQPPPPPPRTSNDDDPFGGTGDFTPIGG